MENPQYKSETHSYFFGFVKIRKASVKGLGVNVKQYYQKKEGIGMCVIGLKVN